MTMDRTLKSRTGLGGTRSVLSRAERIARMTEDGKFEIGKNSPLGLPKTKVRHSKAGHKAKKEETAEGAEGAAAAAPAAGKAPAGKAAPAAAAKAPAGKAPAAAAKAPAAKKK